MTEDLYAALGVGRDASEAEIRAGYRRSAKRAHPDAGGTPEEFAKIGRALAILTNPRTKSTYDRTGEAEPDGPDNEHIEIGNMVMQAVLFAVTNGDVRFTDIVRGGLAHIDDKLREVREQIRMQKAAANDSIVKVEAVLKRLKRKKDDGPDRLTDMLHGAIADYRRVLEKNLLQLEPQERKIKAAREILSGYQYTPDKREPQPQGWTRLGLDDLMRQQGGSFFR